MSAISERLRKKKIADALRGYQPWLFWGTFTFRDFIPEARAHRRFHDFCRMLASRTDSHFTVAWSYGLQRREVLHFHALFGPPLDDGRVLTLDDFDHAWPGNKKVEPYDPSKDGAGYTVEKHPHLEIAVACPRRPTCRRRGCRFGTWPAPERCA